MILTILILCIIILLTIIFFIATLSKVTDIVFGEVDKIKSELTKESNIYIRNKTTHQILFIGCFKLKDVNIVFLKKILDMIYDDYSMKHNDYICFYNLMQADKQEGNIYIDIDSSIYERLVCKDQ